MREQTNAAGTTQWLEASRSLRMSAHVPSRRRDGACLTSSLASAKTASRNQMLAIKPTAGVVRELGTTGCS